MIDLINQIESTIDESELKQCAESLERVLDQHVTSGHTSVKLNMVVHDMDGEVF
jgi:hypothetical protein